MKSEIEKKVDEIFDRFEKKVMEDPGGDLGSCQYDTIQYTAEFVKELLDVLGPEKTEKSLEIKYSRKTTDLVEFENGLCQMCIGTDWTDFDNDRDYDSLEEFLTNEFPEYLDNFREYRISVQAYMDMARSQAWDLWSAMPSIFHDLEIKDIGLPTFGPMLNAMAQDENYRLGIDLGFILYYFGSAGVTIQDFADFDT